MAKIFINIDDKKLEVETGKTILQRILLNVHSFI
jgi:NADH dehydrogenase/NADH:ubiquinone oxidoreductase subunit G